MKTIKATITLKIPIEITTSEMRFFDSYVGRYGEPGVSPFMMRISIPPYQVMPGMTVDKREFDSFNAQHSSILESMSRDMINQCATEITPAIHSAVIQAYEEYKRNN